MKAIRALALSLALAGLPSAILSAQDGGPLDPAVVYPNSLGVYTAIPPNFDLLGMTLIPALHYQRWIGKVGVSASAGYYKPDAVSYTALALGEVSYSVYGSAFTKWLAGQLYVFGSAAYFGNADWGIPAVNGFEAGLGIGIEPILFEQYSFPIEAGYFLRIPFDIGFAVRVGQRIRF
jgi:hypothetical protein